MKNNEIIEINKEVWIPDIKKEITSWEEFSQSIFCEDPEDKQNALNRANDLRKFLSLVESNTLTHQQFEHYFGNTSQCDNSRNGRKPVTGNRPTRSDDGRAERIYYGKTV